MKDKFIYRVYCNLFGEAYFSSSKKAIAFKEYLVKNYELEILNVWRGTGATPLHNEYFGGNFIKIKKIILNLY